MRMNRYMIAVALGIGICQVGMAQVQAGAPAGSTGQCKDGSYSNAAKKAGACRGHQGVKQWFAPDTAAASATPAANSGKVAAAAAAPSPAPSAPLVSTTAPAAVVPARAAKPSPSSVNNVATAPGGGPGMVWLNTPTNVYHCSSSRYYGKTKEGKYMTEAQAKAAGAHPDHGKGCGQ
jgi:Protein of unknown function (DUF3761)